MKHNETGLEFTRDVDLGPMGLVRFEWASGAVVETLWHKIEIDALKPGVLFRCFKDGSIDLPAGTVGAIRKDGGTTVVEIQCTDD